MLSWGACCLTSPRGKEIKLMRDVAIAQPREEDAACVIYTAQAEVSVSLSAAPRTQED